MNRKKGSQIYYKNFRKRFNEHKDNISRTPSTNANIDMIS